MNNYRIAPKIKQQTLREFIILSCKLENIDVEEQDISKTMANQNKIQNKEILGNPHVIGHFKAINRTQMLAANPKLFEKSNDKSFKKDFDFLKDLHHSLLSYHAYFGKEIQKDDFASLEQKIEPYLRQSQIGTWRTTQKTLGMRKMPDPKYIKPLLQDWFNDACQIHQELKTKIEKPNRLTNQDLLRMDQFAIKSELAICCIKPFEDGSNRIARLVGNMIRLNFQLPWRNPKPKIKDKYLEEIWKMQDEINNNGYPKQWENIYF